MIQYVEGDTALTPDQGRTSGSNGIQRGGMQIRQAAATAREALIELAAPRLNMKAEISSQTRSRCGPRAAARSSLRRPDRRAQLNLNSIQGAPQESGDLHVSGQPLPRPDVPAKCTGSFTYMQDFSPARYGPCAVIRPPAIGAKLISVDESRSRIAGASASADQGFSRSRCRR